MRQIYCLLLTAVTFLGVTVTVTAVNFFVNAEGYACILGNYNGFLAKLSIAIFKKTGVAVYCIDYSARFESGLFFYQN